MKRTMKKIPKKWYSGLAIVAFLALSVMTAYNIQIGNNTPQAVNESDQEKLEESKDTIGSVATEEQSGKKEEKDASDDNKTSRDKMLEEITDDTEKETDTEDETDTEAGEEKDGEAEEDSDEKKSTFHYDGEKTLTWPVVGNVIMPYSMDTTVYYTTLDQYACSDGIMISAQKGEEVKASADGRVVNLYESDRYGLMMTVLIGDYYEISYAQIENVNYQIGDEVKQGDVLATVAEPSRSFVLEGPNLFMRLTYKGEAVNPADYLKS